MHKSVNTNIHNKTVVTIAVGSKNPVKYNASVNGAERALCGNVSVQASGFNVPSGVSDQPMGDVETKSGAVTRAKNAFIEYTKTFEGVPPTYAIGLEGGVVVTTDNEMECFAWIAVYDGSTIGTARTSSFALPHIIRDLVMVEGLELGAADDRVFGTQNSKQATGAVGQLTKGVINRAEYYEQAVVLAFIPFQWPELYESATATEANATTTNSDESPVAMESQDNQ